MRANCNNKTEACALAPKCMFTCTGTGEDALGRLRKARKPQPGESSAEAAKRETFETLKKYFSAKSQPRYYQAYGNDPSFRDQTVKAFAEALLIL